MTRGCRPKKVPESFWESLTPAQWAEGDEAVRARVLDELGVTVSVDHCKKTRLSYGFKRSRSRGRPPAHRQGFVKAVR